MDEIDTKDKTPKYEDNTRSFTSTPQPGPSHEYKDIVNTDTNTFESNNCVETAMEVSESSSSIKGKGSPQLSASPTSFLNYSEDDDEDDDDDLLLTAPLFLKSIEEITNQPSPDSSMDHINWNSSINLIDSPVPLKHVTQTNPKSKLCLDNLLNEHTGKADHIKEYNELKTELKTDGGFVNILIKEEGAIVEEMELQEDHDQILKQMNTGEEDMPEERPGLGVFDTTQYCCLFDETLHPCHCGFTITDNCTTTERHIRDSKQDQFLMLVQSDILSMCFHNIRCQNQLLRWLFFIMSVDDNYMLRQGCSKTLKNIIHQQRVQQNKIWSPSLYDFCTVLGNYGASLVSLIPKEMKSKFSEQTLRHQFTTRPNMKELSQLNSTYEDNIKDKLPMVLEILAISLMKNNSTHCPSDLNIFVAVLSKMALDPLFKNLFANGNICICMDMVIQSYTDTDWEKEKIHICRVLQNVSTHHHDMCFITNLLPEGERGVFVRRRVSFLMLSTLLGNQAVPDTDLHDLTIKDLYQFVPAMTTLLFEDLYKLSSVITLLDKCVVSNFLLTSTDRDELKKLIELLSKLRVKDNVTMRNRNKVKDMLVRLTCCWSLDIQTFKSKQTKIFEYVSFQSPVRMKIEKIGNHNSDVSDISQSETSDDEDIEIPRKMPKLESIGNVS